MNVYDVVERQRAALLAREYDSVKRILRAYESAERRVESSIRAFQARITQAQAAGLTPSLAWYYQEARLENVLREMRMTMDEFSTHALEFSQSLRTDAYSLGAVHAVRLSEMQVYGDVAGLHRGAIADAQALLSSTSPLTALFNEIGPMATQAASGVFAAAVAEGWNPRKLGATLAREVEGLTRTRAVLIARTEAIRAYRTANRDVYRRNADVLRGWRWTSAKTRATCALCLAMDGEVFGPDEVLSSHPACRCSMVPLPRTEFGGPQPASGEDYFRSLPPGEQDRILGKAKGAMYRDGQMTLKDNVQVVDHPDWGRQLRPRPLTWVRSRSGSGTLPSQQGVNRVHTFDPPAPRPFPADALDPSSSALAAWDALPANKAGTKAPTFKVAKRPYPAPPRPIGSYASVVEEVGLSSLVSTVPRIKDTAVRSAIGSLGDGPDLPLVVRDGAALLIHDAASLARLQAKSLLGQTRASVRVIDASEFAPPRSAYAVAPWRDW